MDIKLNFLASLGFDTEEILEMDEVTFLDKYGKKVLVFHEDEFKDYCKYLMHNEISYLPNDFLKKFLKPQYRFDCIIDELKEFSKYEPKIILEKIEIKIDLFWLEVIKLININEIEKLIFEESEILQNGSFANVFAIHES